MRSAFEDLAGATIYPAATATSLHGQRVYRPSMLSLEAGVGFAVDRKRHQTLKRRGTQYFGQFLEDCRVRALLEAARMHPDRPGKKLFLEMGALNGIRYSNSLAFERAGWRGVLIEASPANCRALQDNRRSGRTVNICAAVCAAGSGPLEFELVKSATSHLARPLLPNATTEQRARHIRVPCLPLSQMLRELGVPRITYFSLDVEGAEADVLSTFDWSSVPVDILEIEKDRDIEKGRAIATMLRANGMVHLSGRNAQDNMYVSSAVRRHLNSSYFDAIIKAQARADPSFACT